MHCERLRKKYKVPEAKGPGGHQTTQPTVDLCPVESDSLLLPLALCLPIPHILLMPSLLTLTGRARNCYLCCTTSKVPSG